MSQRQINRAHMRALKITYKHLSPPEKRLVKAQEQIEIHDRSIWKIERILIAKFGDNWRRNRSIQDNSNYILFFDLCLENIKLSERITRIEDKFGLDRDEVIKRHRQYNSCRFYGGAF